MKKNTFYLLCGAAAILLVLLFNLSVELKLPWLIFVGIVAAVVAYIICRKKIAGISGDEREMLIDMKTASATLKAAAVVYLAVNIPLAVYAFSFPQMILPPPHLPVPPVSIPLVSLGSVALIELVLLAAVLFIYVGFHVYYAKKYGGDDEDEE